LPCGLRVSLLNILQEMGGEARRFRKNSGLFGALRQCRGPDGMVAAGNIRSTVTNAVSAGEMPGHERSVTVPGDYPPGRMRRAVCSPRARRMSGCRRHPVAGSRHPRTAAVASIAAGGSVGGGPMLLLPGCAALLELGFHVCQYLRQAGLLFSRQHV